MKRAYVLAAVALIVVAGFVGQRLLSDDDEPAPRTPTSSSTLDDEAKAQADQYAAAMEELKKDTEAAANPHELVVTIRDELPLEVWDSNCHLDRIPGAPTLAVLNDDYKPLTDTVALPTEARQLPNGGCEATVAVNVPEFPAYHVGVVIEGRGISDGKQPPSVKIQGKSQKVTVVE